MRKFKNIKTNDVVTETESVFRTELGEPIHQRFIFNSCDWEEIIEEQLSIEQIMQECIKRFPRGSKVKCAFDNKVYQIAQKFTTPKEHDWFEGVYYYGTSDSILAIEEGKNKGFHLYYNGKFAELVEEPKEYEILSFRNKNNNEITKINSFLSPLATSDYLKSLCFEIHSIRRISDGEVFTLNNRIISSWTRIDGTIKSIHLNDEGKIYFKLNENLSEPGLSTVSKVKVLFITEDKVEIFDENQRVFGVLPKAQWQTNYYAGEGIPWRLAKPRENYKSAWLWFSSKESAEIYIKNNKPLLSLTDIDNCYNSAPKNSPLYQGFRENLQELVKNKLKL